MSKTLKKNGFKILYFHPNTIFISWDVENRIQNKSETKKKKENNNNFKLIDDYNPRGNFVYNESALLNVRDKVKNLTL